MSSDQSMAINTVVGVKPCRNISIELLRILCCFLVVAIHVAPMHDAYLKLDVSSFEKMESLLIQSVVRLGLPVFFIISGIFILNDNKKVGIAGFYRKRLVGLLIPFLVFSAIHYFIAGYGIKEAEVPELLQGYLVGLLSKTGIAVHFWFVYVMLGIYLVSPAFSIMYSGISERGAVVIFIILIASKSYIVYFSWLIPGLEIPNIPTWLTYFLLGGLIPRLPKVNSKWLLLAFVISFCLTCIMTYVQFSGLTKLYLAPFDSGVNMLLMSTSCCMLFYSMSITVNEKLRKTVCFIASLSYGVYLIHFLILIEIGRYFDITWYIHNPVLYTVLMTLAVFASAMLVSAVINKLLVDRVVKYFA
ncbi:acyltransferase [Enterobacter sp. 638]|uniref:Acyltransferase 3 n=1 Tax=Enterobacter sp. (strain 638) TaxID=399742 RepID=A0A9J9GHE0_ENT38|nr:acyltransferase [Enterobacter sp. 638]ABP61249.1 acyltransferase 3 [Enterobacter sp. 638]